MIALIVTAATITNVLAFIIFTGETISWKIFLLLVVAVTTVSAFLVPLGFFSLLVFLLQVVFCLSMAVYWGYWQRR